MGVRRSDYILIGYEVTANLQDYSENYIDEFIEKYDRMGKVKGDLVLLEDCYSGLYSYFGVIISYDKDGYDGLQPFEYDVDGYKEEKEKVKFAANDEFGINLEIEPKLIVLTHWR